MNHDLLIIYSNLGLGGIPKKIVDIANYIVQNDSTANVWIILHKATDFSYRSQLDQRVKLTIFSKSGEAKPFLFFLFIVSVILKGSARRILTYISAYAIPVLIIKKIFIWLNLSIVIGEDHLSSNMITQMRMPVIQRIGIKYLYKNANLIIVPSKAIKKDLTENFLLEKSKIVVNPNWTTFSNRKYPLEKRTIDLLYAGRLVKEKKVTDLIPLLYELKKHVFFRAYILGNGTESRLLQQSLIRYDLKKNVIMQPATLALATLLNKTKIVVLLSGDTEGMPLIILEAMASGAIPIVSKFSGADEVILNGINGFIVREPNEAIEIVKTLLTKKTLFKNISKAALKTVKEKYTKKNLISYVKTIYEEPF